MLFNEEGQAVEAISVESFQKLLQEAAIDFPRITKNEIDEMSHDSDGFAKLVALLQVSWFAVQIMGRLISIQGFPVTELEVMTIALASAGGLLYFFWWDKPVNIQSPVPVKLISRNGDLGGI